MPEITVSGGAERRLRADRASLHVSENFAESTREAVYTRAAEAHARLVERAKQLVAESVAERYVAEPISTYSNSWRDEHGATIVEHRATVNVSVALLALDRVGELTADLSIAGADTRVDWELSAETRQSVQRELRGEAVAAARAAAEDYAAALGAAGVEIVSLRDTQSGYVPMPRSGVRLAMADAMPTPEVSIAELTVRADLEAVFVTR